MRNTIISYLEMCNREGLSLQRGMNFRIHGHHSVILMSLRRNAPYRDRIEENGVILIYEGHDLQRGQGAPHPKTFHLVDSWVEHDGERKVFKFKLVTIEENDSAQPVANNSPGLPKSSRVIPTAVKLRVWQRDRGQCTLCGASDELHFDHVIPFSKGGTSLTEENVQLLCARHNLEKRANIE